MLLVATMVAITLTSCERDSTGTGGAGGGGITPAGFVDLGLPSGTKWKATNEPGYYNYGVAVDNFGSKLPTKEQFEELISKCQRTWVGNDHRDLKLTGHSGNSIILPDAGSRDCYGNVGGVGNGGYYWSSTLYTPYDYDSGESYYLSFEQGEVHIRAFERCRGFSVRLVQN